MRAPRGFAHLDGFLAGDTVRIAGPVTKGSARVAHADHLLPMLRRAYKVAATPPYGPLFLAVPMDVFHAEVSDDSVRPTWLVA